MKYPQFSLFILLQTLASGHCGHDRMIVDLHLPIKSVPITTIVVSSTNGQVYLIELYVIEFS